jgi:hypothetical protein
MFSIAIDPSIVWINVPGSKPFLHALAILPNTLDFADLTPRLAAVSAFSAIFPPTRPMISSASTIAMPCQTFMPPRIPATTDLTAFPVSTAFHARIPKRRLLLTGPPIVNVPIGSYPLIGWFPT